MRRRHAGVPRWWAATVVIACVVLAGGGPASAAGAQATVTYTIVETRGITIDVRPEGGGAVSFAGAATQLAVQVDGASPVELCAGGTTSTVLPGDATTIALADAPLRYRIVSDPSETRLTFIVSAS